MSLRSLPITIVFILMFFSILVLSAFILALVREYGISYVMNYLIPMAVVSAFVIIFIIIIAKKVGVL